ncbi:MAG TPA: AAA family ATPase [Bacteroidales bacterium]|nr:AAA family ATPase [Bacteroidales bacterium]
MGTTNIHETNPQLLLANEFVQYTHQNIFLTGKAGTGKTTFLRNLRESCPKRMAVLAPTGVAAINAGGVTIHSFFQLPFTPFIPEHQPASRPKNNTGESQEGFVHKMTRNKIKLIRSLDLLVIDEISMVRADLLDAIDSMLRRYRYNQRPFGGLQLLMIGDLNQLAPVVKEDEWRLLSEYYSNAYFFNSHALGKAGFTTIELKQIYRQEDQKFIELLGEIRNNSMSQASFDLLNSRYIANFDPDESEGYITLTTHNAGAALINDKKMAALKSRSRRYKANITGDFQSYMFPTDEVLELKPGAQVMFVKNDSSPEKRYYNGKIGRLTRLDEDSVVVECPGDEEEIRVTPEEWSNVKLHLNEETREIEEEIIGSFKQIPLKLAWAITVHKSQGLTFEKAVLDVNQAFASGQVYVALSRCRTLEGLVLISKIQRHAIKTDVNIREFNETAQQNEPGEDSLRESKAAFQQEVVFSIFDFGDLQRQFRSLKKHYQLNASKIHNADEAAFGRIEADAVSEMYEVNDKFNIQLRSIIKQNPDLLPCDNPALQERISKAASYFLEKMALLFAIPMSSIGFDSDNKEVKKEIIESAGRFELAMVLKTAALRAVTGGLDIQTYLRAVSDAEAGFVQTLGLKKLPVESSVKSINHKKLYSQLNAWRASVADDLRVSPFMVMPFNTMKLICDKLPATQRELSKIKGLGKVKLQQFGSDILEMIHDYCLENAIERDAPADDIPAKKKKEKKPESKSVSLALFRENKSIPQIATERGFAESTIWGHLSYYVITGELQAEDLLDAGRIAEIKEFVKGKNVGSLTQIMMESNGKFNFNELRIALADMQSVNDSSEPRK